MLGEPQQTIDQRCEIPQARLQMTRDAMIQLFGVEQFGDPTQVGFNRKAFVPGPTLTQFDITRQRVLFPQALSANAIVLPS